MKRLILVLLFATACVSREKAYTEQYGEVTAVQNKLVCVTYKVLNLKDAYVTNCFLHEEDHWYKVGDVYPNQK